MQVQINRPLQKDITKIQKLFHTVLVDTFKKNEIHEAYDGEIQYLVERNTKNVKQDITSNGSQEYFLVARNEQQVVGIIGFGSPSKEIRKNYKIDFENIPEIKNAFILPEFQRNGIGTQLFEKLIEVLKEKGIEEFVLDSGFTSAQVYWKKKLGNPIVTAKNYWGDGTDYLIWHKSLGDKKV